MKLIFAVIAAFALANIHAEDKPAKQDSSTATAPAKKYKNIDAEAFDKMRKTEKNAVVLDVRTKDEYKQGHIPGSVLLDFNSPDFAKKVA